MVLVVIGMQWVSETCSAGSASLTVSSWVNGLNVYVYIYMVAASKNAETVMARRTRRDMQTSQHSPHFAPPGTGVGSQKVATPKPLRHRLKALNYRTLSLELLRKPGISPRAESAARMRTFTRRSTTGWTLWKDTIPPSPRTLRWALKL